MTSNDCLGDVAFVTYTFNVVIGIYCLFIFTWWMLRTGRPSAWYVYVMGLILSTVLSCGFQMFARFLLLSRDDLYEAFLNSTPWAMKSWVGSLVLAAIAIHASFRFFRRIEKE